MSCCTLVPTYPNVYQRLLLSHFLLKRSDILALKSYPVCVWLCVWDRECATEKEDSRKYKEREREREREELIKYISPEKFVQTELDWKEKSFSSFSRSAPKNPWAWFIIAFLSCLCLLCSEVDGSSQIHGRGFESRFLAVISSSDACFFLNVMA